MDVETLLEGLAGKLGLSSLSPNNDGVCRLIFDEKLLVDIEADETGERIRLYSVVIPLADEPSADIYETLLRANLAKLDGGGNFFGIDADAREVVLFSHLDIRTMDQEAFDGRLESFLDDLEFWMSEYGNGEMGTPNGETNNKTSKPKSDEINNRDRSMNIRV